MSSSIEFCEFTIQVHKLKESFCNSTSKVSKSAPVNVADALVNLETPSGLS